MFLFSGTLVFIGDKIGAFLYYIRVPLTAFIWFHIMIKSIKTRQDILAMSVTHFHVFVATTDRKFKSSLKLFLQTERAWTESG